MAEGLRSGDGHKTHGVHVVSLDGREHVAPLGVAAPSPRGVASSGFGVMWLSTIYQQALSFEKRTITKTLRSSITLPQTSF